MEHINTVHHSIRFTHEHSETEITFLDITLYKGTRFQQNGILDIKTHIKPTNKQLYVHATSYHPPHTGKSITIGETNRYVRTNSDEQNFNQMTKHFRTKLRQRGYKATRSNAYISSVPFSAREQKLKPHRDTTSQPNPIVFVTKYSDSIGDIREVLNNSWKDLHENPTLKRMFPEPPRLAYKSNPSLRNKLVRSKLPPDHQSQPTQHHTLSSSDPIQSPDPNPIDHTNEGNPRMTNPSPNLILRQARSSPNLHKI